MAVITILLLSLGALAMSLATLSAATWYADGVRSREVRIQNELNRKACIETIQHMITRNFFLSGEVILEHLGCKALVSNDNNGNTSISILSIKLN